MSDRRTGQQYWRSFEQMADSQETAKHLENEFPDYNPKEIASMPRRSFMKLMGASMAVAGITATGCRRWPKEELVPSTAGLRDQLPGVPEFFATALERNGVADSVLVTSYDGRPIKVEGNPIHPLFTSWARPDGAPLLGASNVFAQASVLELYDPARTRSVISVTGNDSKTVKSTSWDAFVAAFEAAAARGTVAVLSEASSSLTYADLKAKFVEKYPNSIWAEYEPLTRDAEVEAAQLAFKRNVRPLYHLAKANTIVSLDGDLLGTHPNRIRHANDWSAGRRAADREGVMNRLYIAESCFSITGTVADHRLPIRPTQLASIALGLAAALGVGGVGAPGELTEAQKAWVAAAANELKASGGKGVVAVGQQAAPEIQALAYAINFAIGAVGSTVTFHEVPQSVKHVESLANLVSNIARGSVSALLILGGNPVYDAPADLDLAGRLGTVAVKAHLSLYADETSKACNWHLPRSHSLECWGDSRAWDGSVVLQQPLIQPLYDTKSPVEVLALLSRQTQLDGQSHVRRVISSQLPGAADNAGWRKSLHDGFVANSVYPQVQVQAPASISVTPLQSSSPYEIRFAPSLQVFDGRYANLGWLQECPDPITKLVWDNAALMNKTDADGLALKTGDLVEIKLGSHSLEIPVYVLWGQPKGVITLPLGYGRTDAGPIGGDVSAPNPTEPVGFNAYKLRRSNELYMAFSNPTLNKLGRQHTLVTTQDFQQIDRWSRKGEIERVGAMGDSGTVVREATLSQYKEKPDFVNHVGHRLPLLQLWDAPYPGVELASKIRENDPGAPAAFNIPHAWGMAVDMSTCIGCMACVVACQSENNIPTVGKAMTKMNREMHWIRIDRYFKPKVDEDRKATDFENVDVVYQPMMCVHCESAPCEQVCPVAATVHDTEGLNTMVYNRCIGTRYCSNNCPYKVRRFNYMDWHSRMPRKGAGLELVASAWLGIPDTQQQQSIEHVRRMVYNPEVTVRMRGVMEKCTYCTQRIKAATIKRKAEWAKGNIPHGTKENGQAAFTVDDFEVVTACQQACPTQAITFGNLLDKSSAVRERQDVKRSYTVLEDLNTRARTKYLAKIRNPNQELASATGATPAAAPEHH